ncbi:uncharacterized protein LOC128413360 [Podarcis raffonei]|uniref:uncharacterized protein LOC128413360 n=1 Tax=Podarcis raffonei TaxID=65483 RepID=UPI00232968B4|nr:uncharacterized protein LOC128413360 [Podarcis raffonei]
MPLKTDVLIEIRVKIYKLRPQCEEELPSSGYDYHCAEFSFLNKLARKKEGKSLVLLSQHQDAPPGLAPSSLPSRHIREARNPSAHSTKGLVRHGETKEREKRQKEDKGAAGRGSPAWQRAGGAARARDVSPPPPPPPYPDAGSSQPLSKEGPAPGSLCPERDFEAADGSGSSSSSLGTIHSGSPSSAEESCLKGSPSEARGARGQAGGRALGTRKGVPPPPPPPLSGFPSEVARSFPWPGFLERFPSGPAATCASGGARGEAGEKRCLRRGRVAKCSQSRCIPSRLRLLPPSLPQLLQAEGETGSGREREPSSTPPPPPPPPPLPPHFAPSCARSPFPPSLSRE